MAYNPSAGTNKKGLLQKLVRNVKPKMLSIKNAMPKNPKMPKGPKMPNTLAVTGGSPFKLNSGLGKTPMSASGSAVTGGGGSNLGTSGVF